MRECEGHSNRKEKLETQRSGREGGSVVASCALCLPWCFVFCVAFQTNANANAVAPARPLLLRSFSCFSFLCCCDRSWREERIWRYSRLGFLASGRPFCGCVCLPLLLAVLFCCVVLSMAVIYKLHEKLLVLCVCLFVPLLVLCCVGAVSLRLLMRAWSFTCACVPASATCESACCWLACLLLACVAWRVS